MLPVETFRVTVAKFVAILRNHSIRFHITGGVTNIAYAEPRMTQDVDFVVGRDELASELDEFLTTLAS